MKVGKVRINNSVERQGKIANAIVTEIDDLPRIRKLFYYDYKGSKGIDTGLGHPATAKPRIGVPRTRACARFADR